MKAVGVLAVESQDLAIEPLSLRKLARLVVSERLGEEIG